MGGTGRLNHPRRNLGWIMGKSENTLTSVAERNDKRGMVLATPIMAFS